MPTVNAFADTAYENYKGIENKIQELRDERDRVFAKWKETGYQEFWAKWEKLTEQIKEEKEELNAHARLIVKYVYGEE
ncbi:MAG: hypothetical protein IJ439_03755 [Tyzzerella sp.]|nr:hypothetical protein [Tyzzerella sp.]